MTACEFDGLRRLFSGRTATDTRRLPPLQNKSERTVRQHSVAVYRKSGLSGRAQLSAFFLEDLLLPATPLEGRGPKPLG